MKAVIWDMDGTLVDSMSMYAHLEEDYLRERGIDPSCLNHKELITLGLADTVEYFRKHFDPAITIEDFRRFSTSRLEVFYGQTAQLKPGAKEAVETLHAQGVRQVLGTATEQRYAHMAMEQLGLRPYFEALYTVSDLGVTKDNPDFFLRITKNLNLIPEEIALFDDAYAALCTAKEVGIHVFGVEDKVYGDREEEVRSVVEKYYKTLDTFSCSDLQ